MKILTFNTHPQDLSFIDERFPFCFSKGFSDFITRYKNNNYIYISDGKILIPAEIRTTLKFITLQFHFSPLSKSAQALSVEAEKLFLEECISFISAKKTCHRILQPANYAVFGVVPDKVRFAPYGTYFVNLINRTSEELLAAMQARYRTAIRQAERSNIKIEETSDQIKLFAELHKTTMQRTGSYYESEEELYQIANCMPAETMVRNIYIDGELQGGLFILFTKFGAYYMHGASADTPLAQGAIKYLHYNTMVKLSHMGVAFYDFVGARLTDVTGTKLEGIQNFKKRFGADLKKGFLWKKDIDRVKCNMFDYALKTRNLLKGLKNPVDIIEQELKKING